VVVTAQAGTASFTGSLGDKDKITEISVDTGIDVITYPEIWGIDAQPSTGYTGIFALPEIYYTPPKVGNWIAHMSVSWAIIPPAEGTFPFQYTLRYYYK
jgi:hypothetical protein